MDELKEVEIQLRRLQDEADQTKATARALKKDNTLLKSRNEYLVNKLKEASYVYGEAGKRLLYFINNQVNPVIERLNKLESGEKQLKSADSKVGESFLTLEKMYKDDLKKSDRKINSIVDNVASMQEKIYDTMKKSVRRMEKNDTQIDEKIVNTFSEFDKKINNLKTAQDRKNSLKINAFEKRFEGKISILRERNLLIGKDIEALRKFENDIEGLEGRLQETISHLTQSKMDMGKLESKTKATVTRSRNEIMREIEKISEEFDKKIISFASELRNADDKNFKKTTHEVTSHQTVLEKELDEFQQRLYKTQKTLKNDFKETSEMIKSDFNLFKNDLEKRMKLLKSGIDANRKHSESFQKMITEKVANMDNAIVANSGEIKNISSFKSEIDQLAKEASQLGARMSRAEKELTDNIDSFRDKFEKNKIVIDNSLVNIDKKIDEKVRQASSELAQENTAIITKLKEDIVENTNSINQKLGLFSKEMSRIKSIESELKSLGAGLRRREDDAQAMNSRIDAVSSGITDKSEKDDMRLKEQIGLLKSEINSKMEATETNMVKENVRAFSDARRVLKKDVHALREENAKLKAEMKGIRDLANAVDTLRRDVVVMGRKVSEYGNTLETVSKGVSTHAEKEALRISKDMAGIASKLKADLKDMISHEKESFARQSAGLNAKTKNIEDALSATTKQIEEMASRESAGMTHTASNKKHIASLDKKVDKLLGEIVGLKKEYKVEMDKLLKEIEG